MLWDRYVYRRRNGVFELWDQLFDKRSIRLLYIAGRGFDVRAQSVMSSFIDNLRSPDRNIENAHLMLVGFPDYQLDDDISDLTEENTKNLIEIFSSVGSSENVLISSSVEGEDDISTNIALNAGVKKVIDAIDEQTDVILDISSLPRVVYLALLTNILNKLVPDKSTGPVDAHGHSLEASGINFQVLVAEDAELDGNIKTEDPSNELVLIPGFTGALHLESVSDWPTVWFPILGENRVGQLQKIMSLVEISDSAEICPVLPHPSKNPRRADNLLIEFSKLLFESRRTPISNILHVHEANPFEVYRQLLQAMHRYTNSMKILGGCSLIVVPLGSKLVTVGAGLACFEMRPTDSGADYGVAIPYAEPKRYIASVDELRRSKPELSALLLTGEAYS